jgi:hypothetical protein
MTSLVQGLTQETPRLAEPAKLTCGVYSQSRQSAVASPPS